MKPILLIVVCCLAAVSGRAQGSMIPGFSNGLISDTNALNSFLFFADSINNQLQLVDLEKVYRQKYFTVADYVQLDSSDIELARKDMEKGIPFEEFVKKYRYSIISRNIIVIKHAFKGSNGNHLSVVRSYPEGITVCMEEKVKDAKTNTWIFTCSADTIQMQHSLKGFYIRNEFTGTTVSSEYTRLVNYFSSMIDTNKVAVNTPMLTKSTAHQTEGRKLSEFLHWTMSLISFMVARMAAERIVGF